MCCESLAAIAESVVAGAPTRVDRIELNIDMVHAGVAALSEWDPEQEQKALIVVEIFYRMLGKAVLTIPTSS